ncbi:hypothetical protein JW721_02505 [Candidatus Micrarchaeota archaeon]|nr:hypothetical protein [Candidatus Micrarchaeota archaeon]
MAQKQVQKPKQESKVEKALDEMVLAIEESLGREIPEGIKQDVQNLCSFKSKPWTYLQFPDEYPQHLYDKLEKLGKLLEGEGYEISFRGNRKGLGAILLVHAPREPEISKETVPSPAQGDAKKKRGLEPDSPVFRALDEFIRATDGDASDYENLREQLRSGLKNQWELELRRSDPREAHKTLEALNKALVEEGYKVDYRSEDGISTLTILFSEEDMKSILGGNWIARDSVPSKAICEVETKAADYSEDAWYRASVNISKTGGKFAEFRRLVGEVEFANENVRQKKFDSMFKLYSDAAFSKEFLKKYSLLQKKLKEFEALQGKTRGEQMKLSLEIRAIEADVAGYSRWVARMSAYAGKNTEKKAKLAAAQKTIWAKSHESLMNSAPSEVDLLNKLRRLSLDYKQLRSIYAYLKNNLNPECEAAATIELGTGKEAERKAMALGELLRGYPQLNLNVYTVRTIDYISEGKPAWRVELGADWATSKKREETNSP